MNIESPEISIRESDKKEINMRNDEIPKIKDMILETLGETCEKIILFGSYADGTAREESDIDIYVVLKDGGKNPLLVREAIYADLGKHKYYEVDVLANYKSRFEYRCTGPTLERTIARKGVVLYG
ncbi:MAG: nucleotidyltransferase domain-containing protein [Spirochaetaceae bacterium]|jgi:predicted nucleotidyltransferase|nr:nucleotidyltransferase domain-containing protein [Spirochaetaceae bacterium]